MIETASRLPGLGLGLGLGRRLAVYVGLAITIAIGVVATIVIVRDITDRRETFYADGLRTTALAAPKLGGAVHFARPEPITPTLDEIAAGQEEDLVWLAVVDAAGATLAAREINGPVPPEVVAGIISLLAEADGAVLADGVTAAPIHFGLENDLVGALLVGWSEAAITADARADARQLALIGGLLAVGFSLLAWAIIARLVSRPVRAIDQGLLRLAGGDFAHPVPDQHRRDEIGAMARNLEQLRGALGEAADQRAQLEALEKKALTERQAMLAALQDGVGAVVAAARAGDFSRRVEARFDDATLLDLADGVNAICEIISRFLGDGEAAMSALSRGELDHTMAAGYAGRLDDFAGAVNATFGTLKRLVGELQEAEALIAETVGELGRDSEDLSQRAITQATVLQETSATMQELSTTIRTNADNARASAEAVGEAKGQADTSRELISRAVAAMKEIQESTQEITEIVSAIDGFAFQTNLLALNAAVEAARAGDAGKGFAVVASEVRTLAQRAAEAAKDIRRLISVSQTSVDKGAEVVEATGTALSDILASFVAIAPAVADISNATREQSLGVGELTTTLAQIDDTTQMNAHLAERAARHAQALQAQAESLAQAVAFFRRDTSRPKRAARRPGPQAKVPRPVAVIGNAALDADWNEF